jgi:hypothetical protein
MYVITVVIQLGLYLELAQPVDGTMMKAILNGLK